MAAPRCTARTADIFERLYAVRLNQLRKLPEAQILLAGLDGPGLFSSAATTLADVDELDEDALLAQLGIGDEPADQNDITVLRYVRSSVGKRAAEEIADRTPCADFDRFQPLFEQVERELETGVRITRRFGRDASIVSGNYFIVGGQLVFVAEVGETIKRRTVKAMHVCASSTPTARKATCCVVRYNGRSTRMTPVAA